MNVYRVGSTILRMLAKDMKATKLSLNVYVGQCKWKNFFQVIFSDECRATLDWPDGYA